jgi:hypothetical protein
MVNRCGWSPPSAVATGSAATTATGVAGGWTRRTRSLVVLAVLLAFAGGYVAGGGLRWVPWHQVLDRFPGRVSSLSH